MSTDMTVGRNKHEEKKSIWAFAESTDDYDGYYGGDSTDYPEEYGRFTVVWEVSAAAAVEACSIRSFSRMLARIANFCRSLQAVPDEHGHVCVLNRHCC